MRQKIAFVAALWLLILATWVGSSRAGDGCCAHCGCESRCNQVCRLVEEEKKVKITCWGSKCEEFCVPNHSKPGCKHCQMVCTECDANADCHEPHATPMRFVWRDWIPGCARVHTKKKLMKKVITEKVPSFKWVVEDLCPDCTRTCRAENVNIVRNAAPEAAIPLPPTDVAPEPLVESAGAVAMGVRGR
jgi:hypothetical protein